MNGQIIAAIDFKFYSLEWLMLPNITCQIEELQFIWTCFSHATNKQLIGFVLLITSKEKIIGTHRQRIAPIIQAHTHAYRVLFLITPSL